MMVFIYDKFIEFVLCYLVIKLEGVVVCDVYEVVVDVLGLDDS